MQHIDCLSEQEHLRRARKDLQSGPENYIRFYIERKCVMSSTIISAYLLRHDDDVTRGALRLPLTH